MVQKYAVVDANHVFAPLGATWGNVGRFPGALGGPPQLTQSPVLVKVTLYFRVARHPPSERSLVI